jgi:hypothetical protein
VPQTALAVALLYPLLYQMRLQVTLPLVLADAAGLWCYSAFNLSSVAAGGATAVAAGAMSLLVTLLIEYRGRLLFAGGLQHGAGHRGLEHHMVAAPSDGAGARGAQGGGR